MPRVAIHADGRRAVGASGVPIASDRRQRLLSVHCRHEFAVLFLLSASVVVVNRVDSSLAERFPQNLRSVSVRSLTTTLTTTYDKGGIMIRAFGRAARVTLWLSLLGVG